MSLTRAAILSAALLSPLTANAAAGIFFPSGTFGQSAEATLTVALDVRGDGTDYYVALQLPQAATQPFAVVAALPAKPDEVAVAPPGVLAALAAASGGSVLPCSSPTQSCGVSPPPNTVAVPEPAPFPGGALGLRTMLDSAVVDNAADARATLKKWGFDASGGGAALDAAVRDGFVLLLARFEGENTFDGKITAPGASLRAFFKGAQPPFQVPLSFHPGLTGRVHAALITLGDARRGAVSGVEVRPISQTAVPARGNGGSTGLRSLDDRGDIDTAVANTLNGQPALVLEAAQYLHQADVAARMPTCSFGESDPDAVGCQPAQGGCNAPDCTQPVPPEPPDAGGRVDAGSRDAGAPDAGSSDGGASDGSVLTAEKSSGEFPRLFPRDRFVTRFSMTGEVSQLAGTASVSLEDTATGVGPTYQNCPAQEDGGCSAAPGPATLGLGWVLLATLLRRRAR